jgi:aspartate ammonia-lyase
VFTQKCVRGIRANRQRCLGYAERSAALVTAVAPLIGYDAAAEAYRRALVEDLPIRQVIVDAGLLAPEKAEEAFDLLRLTRGGRA